MWHPFTLTLYFSQLCKAVKQTENCQKTKSKPCEKNKVPTTATQFPNDMTKPLQGNYLQLQIRKNP